VDPQVQHHLPKTKGSLHDPQPVDQSPFADFLMTENVSYHLPTTRGGPYNQELVDKQNNGVSNLI
jgi:hypothetical protein